jgi:Ca-activated chloride channel family protein
VPAVERGTGSESVAKLFARERVEDVEMRLTAGVGAGHDAEIEEIGKTFSIATRLTSFIAVSEEVTVDPRAPSRRETQPQALPYGMSAEGLGLRSSAPVMPAMAMRSARAMTTTMMPASAPRSAGGPMLPGADGFGAPLPPPAPAPAPVRPAMAAHEGARSAAKREAARASRAEPADFEIGAPRARLDEAQTPAEPVAARDIVARFATRSALGLTLELVVPEPGLELALEGARATVRLADGREIDAVVDVDRSTHAGSYAGGVVLRIVLALVDGRGLDVDEAIVQLANGVTVRARA